MRDYWRRVWRGLTTRGPVVIADTELKVYGDCNGVTAEPTEDGKVRLSIVCNNGTRVELTMAPEGAWYVGNRITDAAHEASKDRS